MAAYLYTWNPNRWTWTDLPEAVCRIGDGEPYDVYWSCGNTKKIIAGDIFFLIRLGVPPKGIIGCGYVASAPFPLPHWDATRAAMGDTALRTDLLFKTLSDAPIIPIDALHSRFPSYNWAPQASGITMPESIATELFLEIQTSPAFGFAIETIDTLRVYAEGKPKVVTTKTYDRSPHARQACVEHHGYACSVCEFDFANRYGEIGKNFIEVHHLRAISDIRKEHVVDPIKDLRPVCANCHRMLHRRRPAFAIEELTKFLRGRY